MFGSTAAEPKRPALTSYFGKAPVLDGSLVQGEWSDATEIQGVRDWVPEFSPVNDAADLSLRGWVKHDDDWLYFAFEITDDILYALDTGRWLPKENPKAHELTREGFPWFGDEMEILLNAPNTWRGDEGAEGDGASWQMVCNLTKSRLGGLGVGGLLEGEPRREAKAWDTCPSVDQSGAQSRGQAAWRTRLRDRVGDSFQSVRQFAPGKFYSPSPRRMDGWLNHRRGRPGYTRQGAGNFGNFHHEQWWAGAPHARTQKNNFGTLRLMGKTVNPKPAILK